MEMEPTENGSFCLFAANGKRKQQASVCLLQTENGNSTLPLFAANGNGKRKYVFLGRQMIMVIKDYSFRKVAHLW
jgi:hypothetical protein